MTMTARLTQLEQTVARLADQKGERVSEILSAGLAQLRAGTFEPPVYDIAELERQARGTGSGRS